MSKKSTMKGRRKLGLIISFANDIETSFTYTCQHVFKDDKQVKRFHVAHRFENCFQPASARPELTAAKY